MCVAGCVPLVTHAPNIDPGPAFEVSAWLPASVRDTGPGYKPFLAPPVSMLLAYGWRDSLSDAALRVAAGVTSIFEFDLDAYAQLPHRALLGLDGGIGVSALVPSLASTFPMPYAELGFIRSRSGPYFVAGYIHQSNDTLAVEGPFTLHADGWQATIAYEIAGIGGSVRPFVTTMIGHRYSLHCAGKFSDCSGYPRARTLILGVDLEAFPRR